METESGDKLANFFNNIYARFFELVDDDGEPENNDKTDENMEGTNSGTQEKSGEKCYIMSVMWKLKSCF